jgi:hypothetical protein
MCYEYVLNPPLPPVLNPLLCSTSRVIYASSDGQLITVEEGQDDCPDEDGGMEGVDEEGGGAGGGAGNALFYIY